MRVELATTPRTTATKWIIDSDATTFIGPLNYGEEAEALQYISLLTSANGKPVDTIAEIDVDPYMLTQYAVNDYVLRRYQPTKGKGHPENMGPTGAVCTW